jgi:hypothetical protein
MNRVLVGSSNVYRYYNRGEYPNFNEYLSARCTDIKSFEAIMTNLGKNDKEVIVSVLENFIDKAGSTESSDEGWALEVGATIEKFFKIIRESATRNPETKMVIVDPIWRPKLAWYQNIFDDIVTTCKESVANMKKNNITRIEAIPEGCQQFETDQVHLTAESAKIFIEGILKNSEIFFRAPQVDLGEEDNEMPSDVDVEDDDVESRLGRLEKHVKARQANDNLVLDRLREEGDATANKLKEDRVVITGITSKAVPPTDPEQRKTWIKKIASDIFESLIPGFDGKIHYVNQAKNKGTHIPLIEVKLDSVDNATKIRKAFAEKKKLNVDLGRIFVSNCVGLSTRVRVDILKAIARKISNKDTSAHVVAFISRPVMHVKLAGSTKTFTFVDAVAQYGNIMSQFELADAYRRAGTSFKGQMEQMFVILREKGGHQHEQQQQRQWQQRQNRRGAGAGTSRKRHRDEDDSAEGGSGSGNARGGFNKRSFRGGNRNKSHRGK